MRLLTIYGRLPGLNEYIDAERSNRYRAANLKAESEQLVTIYARRDLRGWKASGPVLMRYTWYEPNARRDKDNISAYGRKVIQDALVKGGFLAGDGWKHIFGFSDEFGIDWARPRIEVRIYEEDEYAHTNENADSGNSNNLRAAGAAGAAAPIGGAG